MVAGPTSRRSALSEPRTLAFRRSDPAPLEDVIAALASAGAGWVNVSPDVDAENLPPLPSGLGRLFSGRGPAVPMATFVAGARGKPAMVGVEHGTGPKAARRLADAGVVAPSGSRVQQDHPRRGLVVAVPADAPAREVVAFLLVAAAQLSAVPVGDLWYAEIHDG